MTQSVELTLDPAADLVVRDQWRRLADAGLPSSQRSEPSPHHRPHLTLYAGETLPVDGEAALGPVLAGLDLTVRIGAVMLFGPRRDRYVLVRQVVTSVELLDLQQRVATACGADPGGLFGPGRWTPHVTLAPRVAGAEVEAVLAALEAVDELTVRLRAARRWDSVRRTAWWVSGRGG